VCLNFTFLSPYFSVFPYACWFCRLSHTYLLACLPKCRLARILRFVLFTFPSCLILLPKIRYFHKPLLDNHHPVPLSRNLGTLTSWSPLGLSRPVMGLLYLYLIRQHFIDTQSAAKYTSSIVQKILLECSTSRSSTRICPSTYSP